MQIWGSVGKYQIKTKSSFIFRGRFYTRRGLFGSQISKQGGSIFLEKFYNNCHRVPWKNDYFPVWTTFATVPLKDLEFPPIQKFIFEMSNNKTIRYQTFKMLLAAV